jgi:hypothetical protein
MAFTKQKEILHTCPAAAASSHRGGSFLHSTRPCPALTSARDPPLTESSTQDIQILPRRIFDGGTIYVTILSNPNMHKINY